MSALLAKGADPRKGDAKGKTPLHFAAEQAGDSVDLLEQASVPAIRLLVERGARTLTLRSSDEPRNVGSPQPPVTA